LEDVSGFVRVRNRRKKGGKEEKLSSSIASYSKSFVGGEREGEGWSD